MTRCENCGERITGQVVWTSDDVPLCLECYEAISDDPSWVPDDELVAEEGQ